MKPAFRHDEDFLHFSFIRRLHIFHKTFDITFYIYLLTKHLQNHIFSEVRQYHNMADGIQYILSRTAHEGMTKETVEKYPGQKTF